MSNDPSPIRVSSSCVHKFFTGISLKGVTLSISPAAVSLALIAYTLSGHADASAFTTISVCIRASFDFLVPTLNTAFESFSATLAEAFLPETTARVLIAAGGTKLTIQKSMLLKVRTQIVRFRDLPYGVLLTV